MFPFFIDLKIDYPTFNQYITKERSNRYWASTVKKKYTNLTTAKFREHEKIEPPIQIRFIWRAKTRGRDIDGFSFAKKCIMDAMVKSGFIPNDNINNVKRTIDDVEVSDVPGVRLEITKFEED